jgi:transposase
MITDLMQATEGVRRWEPRMRPELKESRWTLQKSPENPSEGQRAELEALTRFNLATVKAYPMRLACQEVCLMESAKGARRRLQARYRWVRMGVERFGALFRDMARIVELVEGHMGGILAHCKRGITNAFLEGRNSVFGAVKRRSRGFRSPEYLKTMLYLVAGKLMLPAP